MNRVVFLLEEASMRNLLVGLLPRPCPDRHGFLVLIARRKERPGEEHPAQVAGMA